MYYFLASMLSIPAQNARTFFLLIEDSTVQKMQCCGWQKVIQLIKSIVHYTSVMVGVESKFSVSFGAIGPGLKF